MVTPLQARPQTIGINAGAAEGIGKRSGWLLQDCIWPIFKLTDPGAEVMYTLWQFNVDAFLEQYDEANMCSHIFASLCGYPTKWAHTLDEGKDISVQDLLMYMDIW